MEAEAIDPITREVIIDKETKKPVMVKYYYAKNDKGEIDYNSDPVPENHPNRSNTPFRQWKGKFEEGVILTLAGIMYDISTVGWKEMLELN